MASDALIGTEIGSYRLTQSLGVGGMGAVYLGVHPLIGKRVAIKVLHAEFADKEDVVKRFFNEAKAVSLLRHPNIVELIDFGQMSSPTGEAIHYCTMELLDGETLRDRIKRGIVSEGEAIHITAQIADAVAAAHHQRIIHRDLKPENVFLVGKQKDIVKILDFGIAKLTGDSGKNNVQTQAGVLLGTPSYMSPEQCMGRPVDARTDVYATGIILFEMCTGRVPYIGEGYADLLIKQISADLPSPRSINPALSVGIERVIARALEKDPVHRFQTMDDFITALAEPSQISGPTQAMAKATPMDSTIVGSSLPISTTLSGAAAEMAHDIPHHVGRPVLQKSNAGKVLLFGVVAAVIVGGGVFAYSTFVHKPGGVGTTGDPQTPPPPTTTKKAKLHISSDPTGAQIKREDTGEVLGTAPTDLELPADGTLLRLVVHKTGYKDALRAVVLNERDATLTFRMTADSKDKDKEKDKEPQKEPESKPQKEPRSTSGSRKSTRTSLPRPPASGDEILAPNLKD